MLKCTSTCTFPHIRHANAVQITHKLVSCRRFSSDSTNSVSFPRAASLVERATPQATLVAQPLSNVTQKTQQQSPTPRYSPTKPPDYVLGQPFFHTHPHLLSKGEITPGITAEEYRARRINLCRYMSEGSLAIITTQPEMWMAHDVPFRYRPGADFWYYTGLEEPGACLVLEKPEGAEKYKLEPIVHLFVREKDPRQELWDGARAGTDGAYCFGASYTYADHLFPSFIATRIAQAKYVYYSPAHRSVDAFYDTPLQAVKKAQPEKFLTGFRNRLLEPQRVVKSNSEIALMQAASRHASAAFAQVMRTCKPGMMEEHLAATFQYEVKSRGSKRLSFPCVVASGANACTLHYLSLDSQMRDGDMVLMDSGSQNHGYCSDISRTFPVNGKFSPAQADLYSIVLEANQECIQKAVVGSSLRQLHHLAQAIMAQGLQKLKVLPQDPNKAKLQLSLYYPHSIGHYLGIDVHDCHSVPSNFELKPNMIITIEPGLYLPMSADVPDKYKGIGIRIEDNVRITKDGPQVLTDAPKTIADIQQTMAS